MVSAVVIRSMVVNIKKGATAHGFPKRSRSQRQWGDLKCPENPMSEVELDEKFRLLVSAAGHDPDAVEEIVGVIETLNTQIDVSQLAAALTPHARNNPETKENDDAQ